MFSRPTDGNATQLTAEQRTALRVRISEARHEELRAKARTHRPCSVCEQLVHRSEFPWQQKGTVCRLCLGGDAP